MGHRPPAATDCVVNVEFVDTATPLALDAAAAEYKVASAVAEI